MGRRQKKKSKSKTRLIPTDEVLSKAEIDSESVIRLKVTVRKGARIESVPLKKLEKLASRSRLYWKFEDGWLILGGLS